MCPPPCAVSRHKLDEASGLEKKANRIRGENVASNFSPVHICCSLVHLFFWNGLANLVAGGGVLSEQPINFSNCFLYLDIQSSALLSDPIRRGSYSDPCPVWVLISGEHGSIKVLPGGVEGSAGKLWAALTPAAVYNRLTPTGKAESPVEVITGPHTRLGYISPVVRAVPEVAVS